MAIHPTSPIANRTPNHIMMLGEPVNAAAMPAVAGISAKCPKP